MATLKDKKSKKSNKTIRVEIMDSKPSGFYIQDLDQINPATIKINDIEFRLTINIGTNRKDKLIKIDLELDSFLKNDDESDEQGLFGIKSFTIFRTPDFNKAVDKGDKFKAPKEFVRKLLNICIGGIRGMLASNLMNTDMRHITLPLLDLSSIKNNL